MKNYYPVFMDLQGKKVLVVGGGRVAARKVLDLLSCQAKVTVVSPRLEPQLKRWAQGGEITSFIEEYNADFLQGAALVIGATSDTQVNRRIAADCKERNIHVNIVDVPALCTFFVPALLRQGPLTIAVSTGGKSPAFARRIREELQDTYSREHGEFVDYLGLLRSRILEEVADSAKRRELFITLAGKEFFADFNALPPLELQGKVEKLIARYRD